MLYRRGYPQSQSSGFPERIGREKAIVVSTLETQECGGPRSARRLRVTVLGKVLHVGNNLAGFSDPLAARRAAHLASQPELGILSQQRTRAGGGRRADRAADPRYLSRNDAIAGGGARPPGGLRRPETTETRPEVGFHQLLPRFARGESVRTTSIRLSAGAARCAWPRNPGPQLVCLHIDGGAPVELLAGSRSIGALRWKRMTAGAGSVGSAP